MSFRNYILNLPKCRLVFLLVVGFCFSLLLVLIWKQYYLASVGSSVFFSPVYWMIMFPLDPFPPLCISTFHSMCRLSSTSWRSLSLHAVAKLLDTRASRSKRGPFMSESNMSNLILKTNVFLGTLPGVFFPGVNLAMDQPGLSICVRGHRGSACPPSSRP